MTHLTILALGSWGDILPNVLLGHKLKAVGYDVRVVSFENFAPLVTQYGLDFEPIPGDAQAIMTSNAGVALAGSGQNVLKQWQSLRATFWQMAEDIAHVLSQPHIWQTDAIINQLPGGIYGRDLAAKLQIPMIAVAVIPMLPTRTMPMVAFPSTLSFLPGYNRLTYQLAELIMFSGFGRPINRWRQKVLGLPKQPLFDAFKLSSLYPTLLGFSQAVVPRPADWGDDVHFTGYWQQSQEPDWTPPDDLVAFLQAGPPPVFIGFGSMSVNDPEQMTREVLQGVRLSGQRAVLQSGWAGLGKHDLPDTIYPLTYAPYAWLFPQMAAIVHHGGSGTTGFSLWAGVSTILTPFLFDQFYWGKRVQALGVGPAPIPHKKLTATRLAAAIETAVSNTAMRQRAAALGQRLQQEDGLATAVTIVQKIVRKDLSDF
ncbi:MAG: glycosyltransferase [Chloroflexota bacterium]